MGVSLVTVIGKGFGLGKGLWCFIIFGERVCSDAGIDKKIGEKKGQYGHFVKFL